MTKDLKVLELQEQGLTLEEIANELKYKDVQGLGKYMNKAGYSKKNGKFVKKENKESSEKTVKVKTEKVITESIEKTELENIKSQLKAIEMWCFDKSYNKQLVVEPKPLDLKATTIKADKDVLEKFDEFSKKYSNVNKAYLITKALEEFMEKYNN